MDRRTVITRIPLYILLIVIIALVLIGSFVSKAKAAEQLPQTVQLKINSQFCDVRTDIVSYLGEKHEEIPLGMGLVNATVYLELFVGPSRSWTMIATGTDGISCVVATGGEWNFISPGVHVPETPTVDH